MPKIISKKPIKTVNITCSNCETVAEYDERKEMWCRDIWTGFLGFKLSFVFLTRCPTCYKENEVSADLISSDIAKEKQQNFRASLISRYDF